MALEPDAGAQQATEERTELATPWNVIVHNDPITLMSYVVMTFQRIFGFTYGKAYRLMMEVHNEGRSIVWTGARERAEIYVQKLHSAQLLASMERIDLQ
jgi:ATP-dependent Clp protease adaptor protein ClpS